MADLQKYYTMPHIKPNQGKCDIRPIPAAQTFLGQHLPSDISRFSQQDDPTIQQHLWPLCRATEAPIRAHAALNFRCFVTNAAKTAIDSLVNTFGPQLGPSRQACLRQDLYPCVLDDEGQPISVRLDHDNPRLHFALNDCSPAISVNKNGHPSTEHHAFSLQVLSTFEFNRTRGENLKNWTVRLVKQNKEVKSVLHEYGIHRYQPWSFLSRIKPEQLRQLETQFSNLSTATIDEHVQILEALRQIHQAHQRDARKTGSTQAAKDQLQAKLGRLRSRLEADGLSLPLDLPLETKLKEMMTVLLHCQAQVTQPKSIHEPCGPSSESTILEQLIPATSPSGLDALDQQALIQFHTIVCEQFLPCYQQQRMHYLEQSIQTAIQQRHDFLARQSSERAQQYLQALTYFFCQGLSMQDIAHRVQLHYQYQVSRLLKLSAHPAKASQSSPDLLTSCMLQMAQRLREQFLTWTQTDATPAQQQLLAETPDLLWPLLDGPIQDLTHIFQQARSELSHPQHARESLFAQRFCCLLTTRTAPKGVHPL